jgi:2-phospho-L-lactate transferase/gluconeogenesis factor (CofD/UPF0052 family)
MRRVFLLAVAVLMAAGLGCSKTVLIEDAAFDARTKVVVTFADGATVRGKINIDESVTIVSDEMMFKGQIDNLDDDLIYIENCTFLRRTGDSGAQFDRLVDSRVYLGEDVARFEFSRNDIVKVEQVKIDGLRTATKSAFWLIASSVGLILLGEKS